MSFALSCRGSASLRHLQLLRSLMLLESIFSVSLLLNRSIGIEATAENLTGFLKSLFQKSEAKSAMASCKILPAFTACLKWISDISAQVHGKFALRKH